MIRPTKVLAALAVVALGVVALGALAATASSLFAQERPGGDQQLPPDHPPLGGRRAAR